MDAIGTKEMLSDKSTSISHHLCSFRAWLPIYPSSGHTEQGLCPPQAYHRKATSSHKLPPLVPSVLEAEERQLCPHYVLSSILDESAIEPTVIKTSFSHSTSLLSKEIQSQLVCGYAELPLMIQCS
jgi:hypothetical protein